MFAAAKENERTRGWETMEDEVVDSTTSMIFVCLLGGEDEDGKDLSKSYHLLPSVHSH